MPKPRILQDIFISVVLIFHEDARGLQKEIKDLNELLRLRYSNYEILIIDNFISPTELNKITILLENIPCIRIIRLSRPHSKDICVFVGLEAAIGDIVVIRSQHDPMHLLPQFITKAQKADVVFGISTRKLRRGIVNHYGAKVFYWVNKRFSDISIPENSTYFMALSRRAVNALTRTGRYARHIRYLARQIGYVSEELYYTPKQAYPNEKKNLRELLVSALELSTNYSQHPLRFLAWLGFGASLMNLLYAGYVILVNIVKGHVAEGWTTLSLQSAGMFFLLFAILAFLCEYVGRILDESRREPPYHILEELNSKVSIADATRRNIAR